MSLGELSPEIVYQEKLHGHEHEMLRQEDPHSSERGMVGERKFVQAKRVSKIHWVSPERVGHHPNG